VINCVWSEESLSADNRSWYAIATLVNNALDLAEVGFVHRNGFKQMPNDADGAVVIIHGEHQATQVQPVIDHINRMRWSVVIVIGDEGARFPVDRLQGGRRKVWVQMPVPGRHDWVDRRLICSYPHDCQSYLKLVGPQERDLNWSFAGQVNHQWRRECVQVLRGMTNGYLFESPTFWNGIPRENYYRVMLRSKVVACPAGSCTPDTIRVAEALEAGCVPIVEDRWPPFYPQGSKVKTGYWKYVLGEDPPFPLIYDWREFPGMLAQEIAKWPVNAVRLSNWWSEYKAKWPRFLKEDIDAVR